LKHALKWIVFGVNRQALGALSPDPGLDSMQGRSQPGVRGLKNNFSLTKSGH